MTHSAAREALWVQARLLPEAAWEAQRRLHHRYRQLALARKKAPVIVTALARELSGFVWAIGRQVKPHEKKG